MPVVPLAEARPGDVVFFATKGAFGFLIGVGQWLRRDDRAYRSWHHVAILEEQTPDGWTVIQAARRVDRVWLDDVAKGCPYMIVSCPTSVDRMDVVWQAQQCVGAKYGILTVLSIAFNLLTPSWVHVDFRRDGTWICSALAAWCLHFGGWEGVGHPKDIYELMPAELAVLLLGETVPEPAAT